MNAAEFFRSKAMEQQEKLQKPVGLFMLVDLQGLDRSIPMLSIAKGPTYEIIKGYEDYCPDATKRMFVINAPTWFTWVFSIFKPWLPKKTSEVRVGFCYRFHRCFTKQA